MRQPKFKFGDKICTKDGLPFIIHEITHWIDGYRYSGAYGSGSQWYEDSLELYQEPKQTKLYAYQNETTVIFNLGDFSQGIKGKKTWTRAPEFDLTFGDAE